MNDAYEKINFTDKHKYFSGFQIATPATDEIIHHLGYQTHGKDRLINFVRAIIGALPVNMNTPFIVDNTYVVSFDYLDFILNHGITTTYLYDEDLKVQVRSALIETAQKLESNCNLAPVADFTYTAENLVVTLDASKSDDEDGEIVEYKWKIENEEFSSTGPITQYTFQEKGTYIVELIVVDDKNKKSESLKNSVTVGTVGCMDTAGILYPGVRHINPDGSEGGFVQEGATVTPSVFLGYNVEVCSGSTVTDTARILSNSWGNIPTIRISDGAQIRGNSTVGEFYSGGIIEIGMSSIINNSTINGRSNITASQIINTTVYESDLDEVQVNNTSFSRIDQSKVIKVNMSADATTISRSTVSDVNMLGYAASIHGSTVSDVEMTGYGTSIGSSTASNVVMGYGAQIFDSSVARVTMGYGAHIFFRSIVTDSRLEYGANVEFNSIVKDSYLHSTYVSQSTLLNVNMTAQYCENVNLTGATTCPPPQ